MFIKLLHGFFKPSSILLSAKQKKVRPLLQRDHNLEAQAKKLLQPYAPLLAERVIVCWNQRLKTTAGLAYYRECKIVLHPALKEISEEEVEKTLRHELAHLLAHYQARGKKIAPHGREWRKACHDLGIPEETRTHQLPFIRKTQKRNYFYRCASCQETLSRVRKPRHKMACLRCCRQYAKGKYDERFRLELLESPSKDIKQQ